MGKLTVTEARTIDLVDYLSSLGYHASKVRAEDYWYYSPFRKERTPSFKVHRKNNIWYDHGTGEGGNIIDFGILYHRMDVRGFLELLSKDFPQATFSFHPPENPVHKAAVEKEKSQDSKIIITDSRQLSNLRLLHYIRSRAISVDLASRYCEEVDFTLYKKRHTAIGFPNGKGGYELRNSYFKGSSSPKTFRFFDNGSKLLQVFEGFFDFLSWQSGFGKDQPVNYNFLVLNSLSFFQQARPTMEKHSSVGLWLDRGTAGLACTLQALKSHPVYENRSDLYKNFDDLNEWLVDQRTQKPTLSRIIKIKRNGRH